MSKRRKRHVRNLAFTLLTLLLVALAVLVPAILATGGPAEALTQPEFQVIADSIDRYIASQTKFTENAGQVQYTDDGEAGFLITAAQLNGRMKLNEGEDAAQNPILVDIFSGDYIPGTAMRFSEPTAADPANAAALRDKVIAHRKAGFSTDIISYCLTGHTESPPVMAYGAMSQAGYFDDPGTPEVETPQSLALKWGRAGWGGTPPNPGYAASGKYSASLATPGNYALPNNTSLNTACSGKTGSELVRCAAAWALSANGGNIGAGITPWNQTLEDSKYLPVDLRNDIAYTMANNSGGAYAIKDPLNTLFNATGGTYDNLKKLDSGGTIINFFTNRTQHTAALAAQGATMLGYEATYAKWGLPRWNNGSPTPAWPEQYTGTAGYAFVASATPFDTTAPAISGLSHGTPGATSATITWNASEPATSLVEYATAANGPYTVVNNPDKTVLKSANHSVTINGLSPNTVYYYKVSSYDGLANGSSSSGQFTTAIPDDATPPTVSNVLPSGDIYTDSATVSADYSDVGSGIDPASAVVKLDGNPLGGCTADAAHVSCPASGLAVGSHTIDVSVKDMAGNPASASGSFNVVDNKAPVVSNGAPTGTINSANPTISASYADAEPSSGIDNAAVTVYLDGAPLSGCTASAGKVECPTSGLSSKNYTAKVVVPDKASPANEGVLEWSFTVDQSTPTVTPVPANDYWTGDNTPELKASTSDVPAGQHINQAEITIDGTACAPVQYDDTSMSCTPSAALGEGPHQVVYKAGFTAGKMGSGQHTVSVDTGKPAIGNLQPSGQVSSNSVTISADLSDTGSGIDNAAVAVYLDNAKLSPGDCTVTSEHVSCQATAGVGKHTYSVQAADKAGNADSKSGEFELNQLSYYFSLYNNSLEDGMNGDWILIHNEGTGNANAMIYIGDVPVAAFDADHGNAIAPGQVTAWSAPRTITYGPVKVVSTNGEPLSVSQRVLYKDSFNEIWATDEDDLAPEYNFTWYDNNPEWGMNEDTIWISNLGSQDASVKIYIGNDANPKATLPLAPGEQTAWSAPETITDGPVRIVDTNGQRLLASQRVFYKDSFNEMPGIPGTKGDMQAMFTWYDNNSGWGMNENWLLVVNKGNQPTDVDIQVGQSSVGEVKNIPAGGVLFWQSPVIRVDGPVIVTSLDNQPIIASQRVLYKNSFEEIQGTVPTDMETGGIFNWYDTDVNRGMINWILVGNENDDNASVDAYIAVNGNFMADPANGDTKYVVKPHSNVTPLYFDTIGGPVKASCSNCDSRKLVISQRVLYKNSFNELVAKPRQYNRPVR